MIDLYFEIRKRICPFNLIMNYIPPKQKILDIGCGNSILYQYFLKDNNYISYTGMDKKTKKIDKFKNLNIKKFFFINQSIENSKIDISKYDCILMIDIMHHLKKNHQKRIIEKILLEMKNGSTLIYKDISNQNFFKGLANRLHDLIFNMQFIHYYESKKIIDFARNNLKIKKIKRFNAQVYWYDHEFLIINK